MRTAANWSAAIPRAARSTSASPSSVRCRRAQALLRSGAQAGDDIWVSGTLGDARLALEVFRGTLSLPAEVFEAARGAHGAADAARGTGPGAARHRHRRPSTSAMACWATWAMCCGSPAWAHRSDTEVAAALMARGRPAAMRDLRLAHVLAGGDDYELAFTAPAAQREAVQAAAKKSATAVTRIGQIESRHRHPVAGRPGPDHAETLRLVRSLCIVMISHPARHWGELAAGRVHCRQQPRISPAW